MSAGFLNTSGFFNIFDNGRGSVQDFLYIDAAYRHVEKPYVELGETAADALHDVEERKLMSSTPLF